MDVTYTGLLLLLLVLSTLLLFPGSLFVFLCFLLFIARLPLLDAAYLNVAVGMEVANLLVAVEGRKVERQNVKEEKVEECLNWKLRLFDFLFISFFGCKDYLRGRTYLGTNLGRYLST